MYKRDITSIIRYIQAVEYIYIYIYIYSIYHVNIFSISLKGYIFIKVEIIYAEKQSL